MVADQGVVVVTGVGRVHVVPDRVELSLGVSHFAPNPAEAFQAAADASRALLGLLEEAGVPSEGRRTTGISLHPSFDRQESRPSGYEALVTVLARCQDLEAASRLLERASASLESSLRIQGLAWVVDDPAPARARASTQALSAALDRARELAEVAGLRLGPLRSVVEHPEVGRPPRRMARMASSGFVAAGGPALEPGTEEEVVAVEVEVSLAEP